ncbi:MAG: TonB-dependent receptor [Prevotellaceae bacterium]|jgi:TonB-linked SusC/RagA family outer membrane protein|nr:TonB-dependent receptor [Prevotellaceae bacterium]
MKIKKKNWRKSFTAGVFFLLCLSVSATLKAQQVNGTVVDEQNAPLGGVSVVLKGSTQGTMTDASGDFVITVSPENTVLVFSCIGYKRQEVEVGGKSSVTVTLQEDNQELDEVVVVGFQTQRRVNLTGAVSSVSSDALGNRSVSNIGQVLQGVVPNLNVSINSGAPNTVPSFNVRGGTSLQYNGGKYEMAFGSPLILLDGFEISESQLNRINPNDIAGVTVIKDASAAAIYGTKATYGVMLVQSKSGSFNQRGIVSYSYDISLDKPSALPDILDSYTIQLASMNKTRWTLGSVSSADEVKLDKMQEYINNPTPENAWYSAGGINWVANVNPYKEVVRGWAPTHKHNLSISGGGSNVSYYVSLGYHRQEGMYKINTDLYQRYNALLGLNAKVTKRFSVGAKISYNATDYAAPYLTGGKGNLWSTMRNETNRNVNMPLKTGPNDPIPNEYTDNILSWLLYGAKTKTYNTSTILSMSPEFVIIPQALKVKADVAYTPQSTEVRSRRPQHSYVSASGWTLVSEQPETQENRGYLQRSSTDGYTVNAYLDFDKTFAEKHTLSAVLGFNQERVTYGSLDATLRKLYSPDIINPNAAEDITLHTINTDARERTGRAGFGRIGYIFDNRYLLEANGRYDGSSRFTPNERYFFFPSFSAGWRISEERFMGSLSGWLNNLKVRGSYGTLGSQTSSYYPYQAVMSSSSAGYLIDGKYVMMVSPPGLVSPKLAWEKTTTINGGLDVSLFNRLDASFDVYERKTSDVLTDGVAAYPAVLGEAAPLENSGKIKAYGWEVSVKWRDKRANGLRYDIGVVLSDTKNKVLHYAGNPSMLLDRIYNGQMVGEIYGYENGGILQESDLVRDGNRYVFYGPYQGRVNANLYPGYVWYKDLNGDGKVDGGASTLNDPGDRKVIGNNTARYRYGVTANFSWKGLDLNIFFQGVGKRDAWISSSAYWGGGAGSRWMYDRSWTPERTNAKFPMYDSGNGGRPQSSYIINAAYLRLKQAVLGYTLPGTLTSKVGISKLRLNVSGYNLFEITKVPRVFDPDQISDAYPAKRTVAFGVQVEF